MPFCAYTLSQTGRDGNDLLRCSRCKTTYFTDRSAQKAAWKMHKHTCKEVTTQVMKEINKLSLDKTMKYLKEAFVGSPSTGAYTGAYSHAIVPLLRRLRDLFDNSSIDGGDAALELHTTCRSIIFHPKRISLLMNCPGLIDYLLGPNCEDDLLWDICKFVKTHFDGYCKHKGDPHEIYIEGCVEDPIEKKRLIDKSREYYDKDMAAHSSWSEPGSMKYCYVAFNLLVAACLQASPSMSSVHDGNGTLRMRPSDNTNLTQAALKRCMELWTDNFVRASCGDAMAPAASLALTALELYGRMPFQSELTGAEMAPGLQIDKLVLTTISEMDELSASQDYSVKCLKFLASRKGYSISKWDKLSNESRAEVIMSIIHYFLEHGTEEKDSDGSCYAPKRAIPKNALMSILDYAIGSDDEKGMAIVTMAAENELLGPKNAGENRDSRAFVYYCIRNDVELNGYSIVNAIHVWKDIPYDKKNAKKKAKESPSSDIMKLFEESVKCTRLAHGKMKV